MIPRLYDENYNLAPPEFANESYNGYGFFDKVLKCEGFEEGNKENTLKMVIADNDRQASKVKPNMLIKVKANPYDDPQLFEIYSVEEDAGEITISANHISYAFESDIISRTRLYELNNESIYLVNPPEHVNYTVSEIISDLFDSDGSQYAYFSTGNLNRRKFSFTSDIADEKPFSFKNFIGKTIGELMMGTEGSLIDVYGGEYHFDNFRITLNQHRGRSYAETGKVIRYGSNLGSLQKSMRSDNVYTHVCCWASVVDEYREESRIIVGSPFTLKNDYTSFEKVKMIDVTDDLRDRWNTVRQSQSGRYNGMFVMPASDEPRVNYTGAAVRGYDRVWAFCTDRAESIGRSNAKPQTDIQVSLTIDSEVELESMQDIRLFDEVCVILKDGTRIDGVKCTSATFDCIREKYTSLGFGARKLSLTNFILKQRR